MSLTDARAMWKLLNEAGEEGVHSHELRRKGISGNPSQRAKDIVSHGVAVFTARENVGKRPGARYWLGEFAPDWAVPVRPNGSGYDEFVDGDSAEKKNDKPALNLTPSSEQTSVKEPVAIVREEDGSLVEQPVTELYGPDWEAELAAIPLVDEAPISDLGWAA